MFPYAPGTYREDNDLKIMPHAPARRSSLENKVLQDNQSWAMNLGMSYLFIWYFRYFQSHGFLLSLS